MTRARSLQTTNILAWLTPVAVILVMVTRRHGQGESHALVSIEPTGSGNEAAGNNQRRGVGVWLGDGESARQFHLATVQIAPRFLLSGRLSPVFI